MSAPATSPYFHPRFLTLKKIISPSFSFLGSFHLHVFKQSGGGVAPTRQYAHTHTHTHANANANTPIGLNL